MIRDETVRALALALPDVEEKPHDGCPSFRAYGGKFCTIFSEPRRAALTLSVPDQARLCGEHPDVITPVAGGFGAMGHTYVDLDKVDRATFERALGLAWRARADKAPKKARRPPEAEP